MKLRHCTYVLLSIFFTTFSFAQKTAIYHNPEADYRLAIELFQKEKYVAAQKQFKTVIDQVSNQQSELNISATYYMALCAVELYNNDAEYLLLSFIRNYPDDIRVKHARFQLAKHQYNKKQFRDCIEILEKINPYDLTDEERAEYYFKLGYSCFSIGENTKAKVCFNEIKEIDSKYQSPTNYYYAHIAYSEKNYETALKTFEKLKQDENFGTIVPYYICQIYYFQGKDDEIIAYAPSLLESASTKRAPEIARLIGEAYYHQKKYVEALPYLEMYRKNANGPVSRDDYYQLAYTYYKTGNYKNAIENFQKVTSVSDTLAQNAFCHLGDCYIKTNEKKFAIKAFLSASKMSFDKTIQEDALFNFAKLSYETSYNPYNEAINAFQRYIDLFPSSPRIDEAYSYLTEIYLSTKNYKDALVSIEKVKIKTEALSLAYQKICYYRGVEFFNDGDVRSAIDLFNAVLKNNVEKAYSAKAIYWKGEAYYRLEKYDSAALSYKSFLTTAGAFSLPLYNMASYNLGYVYFNQKNYDEALLLFRKFIAGKTNETKTIINDAYLRAADCYFIKKEYTNAIDLYDKSIQIKGNDIDYALFQKALAQGALGKFEAKANTLLDLINTCKNSPFIDDAKFELGNTYLALNNNEKALANYKEITSNYPKSSFVKKAYLKMGLIYFNLKNDQEALVVLKKVVKDYPGTTESKEALTTIRNIYMDMNNVDDFMAYVKMVPFANVSNAEQDSITYMAIENRYMDGDCESAVKGFNNYIQKFPSGFFIIPANFYRSECENRMGSIDDALKGFNFVISQPKNQFTEKALLSAANINFTLKDYPQALQCYTKLGEQAENKNSIIEARVGKMRCNYLMKAYDQAIFSAEEVITTEKISSELISESHLVIAKSAFELNNVALSQTHFEIIAKQNKNEIGAEAKYYIAFIQFKLGNYDQAESTIFEFIQQTPSYEYWLAKSYILLSDVYVKKNDLYQAKQTLQSIIDNYEGAELIQLAHEKFNSITEMEQQAQQKKTLQEAPINLNKDKRNDQLFNDELGDDPIEVDTTQEKLNVKEY